MSRIIFLAIALYVAYKLVFELIIPIFKTTQHVRRQFHTMNQAQQQGNNPSQPGSRPAASPKPRPGDYLDFEEIKN